MSNITLENKLEQYAKISLDVLPTLKVDVAIPFSFGLIMTGFVFIWLIIAIINPSSVYVETLFNPIIFLGKIFTIGMALVLIKWFVVSIINIRSYRLKTHIEHINPINKAN